jgi:hypothetical protein
MSIPVTVVVAMLSCVSVGAADPSAAALERIRAGVDRGARMSRLSITKPVVDSRERRTRRGGSEQSGAIANQRDSVWNGALIGAAAGAGGGYLWARNLCGSNDTECSYRAVPAGVLGGAGIGAAIGAILDFFQR